MPTRTRTTNSRTTESERDRELEALGLGIAPGLPGDETGELVERAGRGAGQPRRGASAGGPQAAGIDRALQRASDRRRVHAALGRPPGAGQTHAAAPDRSPRPG